MCLGQISWIVQQNLSMSVDTSLSGLVTGVWRPLCAAFRLTGSDSAQKNIASEITGTQNLPHCLNVLMAYLPMSLSYQTPSKDMFYQQIKVTPWHRTNGESFPRQQATGLASYTCHLLLVSL